MNVDEILIGLPSLAYAIHRLQDGSEDSQMHSFYLQKLADQLRELHKQPPAEPLSVVELQQQFGQTWKALAKQGVIIREVNFEFSVSYPVSGATLNPFLSHMEFKHMTFADV